MRSLRVRDRGFRLKTIRQSRSNDREGVHQMPHDGPQGGSAANTRDGRSSPYRDIVTAADGRNFDDPHSSSDPSVRWTVSGIAVNAPSPRGPIDTTERERSPSWPPKGAVAIAVSVGGVGDRNTRSGPNDGYGSTTALTECRCSQPRQSDKAPCQHLS